MRKKNKRDNLSINKNYSSKIHKSISGIIYPAAKEKIVDYVRSKSADSWALLMSENLPNKVYKNEAEVINYLKAKGFSKNYTKVPDQVKISNKLKQFTRNPSMIIVVGRQEAVIYHASNGSVSLKDSFKFPTPRYSDNEGHFKTRVGGGVVRSGSARELNDEIMVGNFTRMLKARLESLKVDANFKKVYFFSPDHLRRHFMETMPKPLKDRVVDCISGNFFKFHPIDLVKKIMENADVKIVKPISKEARKIMETYYLASATIKA
ncbi:MAG: hypothetical protein A3G52_03005 [Candidatus Taylorbacteria bacterium RIFCSPLOWO2_12_FULL_43_20]|uniref:Uncharacterized protein n=1 Tax=Candidatus Taylorbacteria bacterium RIFCSPLOWO2_12_FULL_43_20 TaxID=1802332 RepID=A0A1G2P340_9BACT|nr:MAG: hypothetical protein A3B98_04225 [Candidatus Taylorbacteria bacterium RIFCSPHIGHO2_02_FULL_43_55]OHA28178.1 MAG: hypothetical protein A3E92_02145 [Candidatus Taylorbacteria bacterium RIFCSPHIGHO2_12_FULL_42_34]OHA31050.1 MAG: hypothetical protein A3B09_04170 [Candidatus Taylorbacteria bacterium RIFCSPLOWO2_01_FULL_43_83]OHA39714.1 MAG: hypothetical protein A3H58_04630 [Candidatus Taylorbacteria bacterium RIFCSPLOWO2_02_FULL_43_22b]OHA42750.1 MAG: hypothetical protein A3G52_03005 [Candid